MNPPASMNPPVSVNDASLAKIAAQAAADVPGVVRLAPSFTRILRKVATATAQRFAGTAHTRPADAPNPDAIEIEHLDDHVVQVTVRIIASGHPVVLDTVSAVGRAVHTALRKFATVDAAVIVLVVDTEPV